MPSTKTRKTHSKSAKKTKPAKKLDGGVYEEIHRSKLKAAPYNPRDIDSYSAKGLRDSIKSSGGLVQPPVWNRRTGNLIAGHQRLAQCDAEWGEDYVVTVCVVDIDERTEKLLNVRLNSPAISGVYDVDRLDELMADLLQNSTDYSELSLGQIGFDVTAMEALHLGAGVDAPEWLTHSADIPDPDSTPEGQQILDDLDDVQGDLEAAKAEEIEAIKRQKLAFRDQQTHTGSNHLNHMILMFPSSDYRAQFLAQLQIPPEQEYIDVHRLAEALGFKYEPPADDSQDSPEDA